MTQDLSTPGRRIGWRDARVPPLRGAIIEHGDMLITDSAALFSTLQSLVESWCDRRCLKALRAVLRGYPLSSPFTDGWGELLIALQDVRAFARDELTDGERASVDDCLRAVERMLRRA